MKRLALLLVLPLTVISFCLFTKWWFVLPEDAPDDLMKGFPLIYTGSAFYTSMARQFFIKELLADMLCYFAFWFGVVYVIHRFIYKFKRHPVLTAFLFVAASILFTLQVWLAAMPENLFLLGRDIKILEVMDTGFYFEFNPPIRPDYSKYHPNTKGH